MNNHGGYYGEQKVNIIDFSVNVNPLGVPNRLIEVLKNSIYDIVRYPQIEGKEAKLAIASHLNISDREVIIGNGAIELIYLFAKSYKNSKVLIVEPTFNEYERAFKINDCEIFHYTTDAKDDFRLDILDFADTIIDLNPDIVVMCNPNNPTGMFVDINRIKLILDLIKRFNVTLLIDESFIEFTKCDSSISLMDEYSIFILRSMTKYYAIPGIRLGYGIGNSELISRLNAIKEPWTLNCFALNTVEELLKDYEYAEKTNAWLIREKEYLCNELEKIQCIKVFDSKANFLLLKLNSYRGSTVKDYLLSRGIYIRTCEDFYGLDDTYIRIAIKEHSDNAMLIDEIRNMSNSL